MYKIQNEKDLYNLANMIVNEDWNFTQELRFCGYPKFQISLQGERFSGGIPTRIMPAILELQKIVDRAAAEILGAKKLKKITRQELEIVVEVRDGSTEIFANLEKVFNAISQIIEKNRMTGNQVVGTVIILIAASLINNGIPLYLESKRHELDRRLKHEESMALIETHRELINVLGNLSDSQNRMIDIILSLGDEFLETENILESNQDFAKGILNQMGPDDKVELERNVQLDGETSKRLLKTPRAPSIEHTIDGSFLILKLNSGSEAIGMRARIRSSETGEEFILTIPEGKLSQKQIVDMQNGEWSKTPLNMRVSITRNRDRIAKAILIEVGSL